MKFPHPDSPDFLEELEAITERMRNPPRWDLLARSANWGSRLERSFIGDDTFASRWVRIGTTVRLLLALALFFATALVLLGSDVPWWWRISMVFYGAIAAIWALSPLMRANAYRSGFIAGSDWGHAQALEAVERHREP